MNYLIAGADFSCIPFLFIIIISVLHLYKHEKKYTYYLVSIAAFILFSLADGIAYLMDELGGNYALHFFTNLFSYIGPDVILAIFVFYVCDEIRSYAPLSKMHARIVLLICAFDTLILTIAAYTGNLFTITEQGSENGSLAGFVGISQIICSVYMIILIMRRRKSIEKKTVVILEVYFFIPFLFIIVELLVPAFGFMYLISAIVMMIVYVVVVQRNLQTSVISEKIMRKASVTDNLTGILNRRAYSETLKALSHSYPVDFVYLSMDVNGLKTVNDSLGHAAGDEIIIGAASCMKKSLGIYGEVFRIGGDEFAAVIYVPQRLTESVINNFVSEVDNWRGTLVDSISVSFGYVKADEAQGHSIEDVAALADKRMYESKSAYYKAKGIDRRGQKDAQVVLQNLYTKILKINITKDTYHIICLGEDELKSDGSVDKSIAKWLRKFGESGNVQESDLDEYFEKTDINFLKNYFRQGKTSISIFYSRKYSEGYKKAVMEMAPTNEYRDDNQELFLYVKPIDK